MEYSIEILLSQHGHEPVYRRANYGMYLSPLRNERDASFKVDYVRNLWFDFGMGQGGNVVSLYMLLNNCSLEEAREKLSGNNLITSFPKRENCDIRSSPLSVKSQSVIHSPSIISYLEERGIPSYVARAYCSELIVENIKKQHLVLGFKNDMGGWEMRNRYLKLSTSPKTISSYVTDPRCQICNVFEGFMDYLSLVALSDCNGIRGTSVILNSVVNLPKAYNLLQKHDNILCYLDNDKAGRETFETIKKNLPNINVEDCSVYYKDYKDLNDCLTGKRMTCSKEKVEISSKCHVGL